MKPDTEIEAKEPDATIAENGRRPSPCSPAECDTCHYWEWNNGRLGFASGYCLLFDKVTHKEEGSECPAWEQIHLENND